MKRHLVRRALIIGWVAISVMAGLAITVAYFKLRSSVVNPQGSRRLAGLEANVRILSDSVGIPHIMASTELDAVRAQGFMHGADRLWQMEFTRRIAAGRLSEIFGERALETDRFVRTLGLWPAAQRAAAALDDADRARLQAYADGVNAAILSRRGIMPPEFVILGFHPDPWTVESSLAVGVVMNLDLSAWRNELSRFVGQSLLPPEKYAALHLPYPEWGPAIAGPQAGGTVEVPAPPRLKPGSADRSSAIPNGGWDPIDVVTGVSTRVASNAWVVSGRRTSSGHPILANDMHLPLRAPAIWYIAALHAFSEDLHVAGFSLPGVPGIVVGLNRNVAWGFTNGMVDDLDFVIEEVSSDGTSFRDGGEWLPLEERIETIRIRGRAEPVELVVRSTSRGPLLSDVLADIEIPLSVLWVAAGDRLRTGGLWALGRAGSGREMDLAVRAFTAPHQNVVYATIGGRIGYRLGGSIPIRDGWTGEIPVPAEVAGPGWRGWWPAERHPAMVDPRRGFIASANNLPALGLGGLISADYPAPFRARRIVDRLQDRTDWTVESTLALQLDTRSLLAEAVLGRAIAAAEQTGQEELAAGLRTWNGDLTVDSWEATVVFAWLYRLRELIAADEWASAPTRAFFPTAALLQVLAVGDESPWVDDVSTPGVETIDELSRLAMHDATRAAAGRPWGEVHVEQHAHPLGTLPLQRWLFGFTVGPYPAPGGPNTVRPDDYRRWNRLDSSSWRPPYVNEYGPSERFVAELDPEGPRGWFIIPTGQSGNPFSPHYRDLNERWRAGRFIEVPLDSAAAVRRAVAQLSLTPDS